MPTLQLHLMVGIPASGKSTYIKSKAQELENDGMTVAVISRDVVRKTLLGIEDEDSVDTTTYFSKENEVFDEFIRQVNEALELGIDHVFVDATHISPASRRKTLSRLRPDPYTTLVLDVLMVGTEVAIQRNANRTGFARVPDDAIRNMQKGFRRPNVQELRDNRFYGFGDYIINNMIWKVKNDA